MKNEYMRTVELPIRPLRGELNTHVFVAGQNDIPLLRRIPRNNLIIMDSLRHEYNEIAFTGNGGHFRRRTPEEQAQLSVFAAIHGLHVLQYANRYGDKTFDYEFFSEAVTLDQYLPLTSPNKAAALTLELFKDLRKAHSLGLIYGDRWSRNILIFPDNTFCHIDFDLEISGPPALSFDVAQLAYYVLAGGREKVLLPLVHILSMNKGWFDTELLFKFLRGHARHFRRSEKYGGIENETETLIELIKKNKGSR